MQFLNNFVYYDYEFVLNTETFSLKSMYVRQFWGIKYFVEMIFVMKNQSICIAFGKIITDMITYH